MAKKKPMSTASRKAKGRNLQYWVAGKVAELFGLTFSYGDDLCPVKSRGMGQQGADVFITDKELARKFPYDIEAKNTEQAPIYKFIEQAKANTKEGSQWLIVHKKNYSKPIVIMDAEHFFELYKSILK